ncbi:MAG: alkaline phosphatase family protein [Saprospiraceae bacterium]|nr:alkaline phosphatase family protein [Saprospiraceae bacterium]
MTRMFSAAMFFLFLPLLLMGQPKKESKPVAGDKPALVVGIVVDQMRWDFLYRYSQRYSQGGFKRLMGEGFSCEQTYIPYTPTVTAAGHACVYTGSVPGVHGVVGNNWYDVNNKRVVYCSEDTLVRALGTRHDTNGLMSPKNMSTTSICDELRLASNFRSKVVGVCIKDRGAIFPAGHSANAAFWFDGSSGKWISSSHYMEALPDWLVAYNDSDPVTRFLKNNWNTIYAKETYTQSTSDEKIYEAKFKGLVSSSLPYRLDTLGKKGNGIIASTPYGNTMTAEVARLAIENYKLGMGQETDFLALSFSSPDYAGHQFGPNSIELEDTYLRLDLEIEGFLKYLDEKIGKGRYTVFLTADHGVAHVPVFLKEQKIPAGAWNSTRTIVDINDQIREKFGLEDVILSEQNYQLYLDYALMAKSGIDQTEVTAFILDELHKVEGIQQAFELKNLASQTLPASVRRSFENGYHPQRSGHIQIIMEAGWIDGWLTGTTHGSWYNYDSHLPMLWYGWGIKHGRSHQKHSMTDIAPTVAALLSIQVPSGSIGEVMEEVLK